MAKSVYTAKEASEKLGVTEDELRQMAGDGKVREFRESGQFVYKVEEVDRLALGGGSDSDAEEVVLEPEGDSGDSLGLSSTGSGSEILLSEDSLLGELGASQSGTEISLEAAGSDLSGTEIPAMPEEVGADGRASGGGDSLDDLGLGGSSTGEISLGGDFGDDSLSGMSGTEIPFRLAEDSLLGGTSSGTMGGGTDDLLSTGSGLDSAAKEASGGASATEISLNMGDDSLLGGSGGTEIPLSLGEDSLLGGLGGSGTEIPLDLAGDSGSMGDSGSGSDLGTGTDVFSLEEDMDPDKEVAAVEAKDGTVITSVGVSVFDDDEADDADPLAGTAESDMADELGLDGVGSGSGLLDLTRESDDTSLGVDLAGELYSDGEEGDEGEMGVGEEAKDKDETALGLEEMGGEAEEAAAAPAAQPVAAMAMASYPQVGPDPLSGMVNGLLMVGILVMIIGGMVSASVIQGVWPAPLDLLYQNFVYFIGGAFGLAAIVGLIGFAMGRR
jgi:hypothetical protein